MLTSCPVARALCTPAWAVRPAFLPCASLAIWSEILLGAASTRCLSRLHLALPRQAQLAEENSFPCKMHPGQIRPPHGPQEQASSPCQDGDLSGNIHPSQVIPGIGLCVAQGFGLAHNLGEGLVLAEHVEDVGQGAAEDALHLEDAIPCVYQVLQGCDHRQASPHCGLQQSRLVEVLQRRSTKASQMEA